MNIEAAERGYFGALFRDGSLYKRAPVSTADLSDKRHQLILSAICSRVEDDLPTNEESVAELLEERGELSTVGGLAYLIELAEGAVPNEKLVANRAERIRRAAHCRRVLKVIERIDRTESLTYESLEQRLEEINQIRHEHKAINGGSLGLFHTYDELANSPPLHYAINGFLQEDGITLIAGPSGDGKTLMMLSMTRSLLDASSLFGYSRFSVPSKSDRVIYLIPESSKGPFWHRLQTFHLAPHVQSGKLLIRTLSSPQQMSLNDPRFHEAAKGAHVFLDTAIRFMEGDESAAGEAKLFAQTLFNIQAAGAKTICGAHHSPKGFDSADYMTLENVVRGSGDIGAMLATCWGIKQVDQSTTSIFVQNVKARDFEPCEPFIIQGRPHIDDHGTFLMKAEPGEAGKLKDNQQRSKSGRKANPDSTELQHRAYELKKAGKSLRAIADEMQVSKSLVHKWVQSPTGGEQCEVI